jgi:4-azaleucine resistance transporter AzlC
VEEALQTSTEVYKRKSLYEGIIDGIPIFIGFIPISVTFGMVAIQAGFNLFQTTLMSVAVLAGASQLMAVNMLTFGAGVIEVILATFILNLRHFIMSMSIMNELRHIPKKWKVLLSFGLTDETFTVLSLKTSTVKPDKFYILGLNGTAYTAWISGTFIGGFFSNFIPPIISLGMSITLYAMFIGLLVPAMKKSLRVMIIAIVSILLNMVLNQFLSSGWSIVLATLVGSSLGIFLNNEQQCKD